MHANDNAINALKASTAITVPGVLVRRCKSFSLQPPFAAADPWLGCTLLLAKGSSF